MNDEDANFFIDALPFQKKKQTKLQKIEEEDHESFVSAGPSVEADYNLKRGSRNMEERKSQVEINLKQIDFTEDSPENKQEI